MYNVGENAREEELFYSCTTLHWCPTPVGRTEVLLRTEIISLFRQRHVNCFVVSRAHLGLAEVESSAGISKEKLTSLETGKFSSSSYVLLIAVLEMNILSNITAIGSFLSYICVNFLSAHQLFLFHSPVGSCLPAIKAGIWELPESL